MTDATERPGVLQPGDTWDPDVGAEAAVTVTATEPGESAAVVVAASERTSWFRRPADDDRGKL